MHPSGSEQRLKEREGVPGWGRTMKTLQLRAFTWWWRAPTGRPRG